jgi:FkbM family methyltransferase
VSDHDPAYWEKLRTLLKGTARPQPVFVDAGTNRGEFTALLLNEFPRASVHAVEPDPQLCAELDKRFAGRAVRTWNVALHEREGTIDLHVHADKGTSSVLPRPAGARRYFASGDAVVATVPVRAMTLDRLASDAGVDRIDFLKLDTQGAELPIVRGAQRLLAASAIDVIYTEFFLVPHYEGAARFDELWAPLQAHGYVLYDLFKGPYGRNGQLRFGDAIFVSPSVRERYLDAFPDED